MRFLPLLAWMAAATATAAALFQTYNGVIDGNVCTGTTPVATGVLTVAAPTNVASGGIGIHQLAFQTVGDWYVYSGGPITINGVSGTYSSQCCSCDAIGQSINGGFSECGLTWCGQENQWQTVDFTGILTVQQNATLTISFPTAVPIAPNANGDPVFSISYGLVPLSPSSSGSTSGSGSVSVTGSISPTGSTTISVSVSPTGSVTESMTGSMSVSGSTTPTGSLSESITGSITPTASVTITGSGSVSVTGSTSPTETASISSSTSPTGSGSVSVTGSTASVTITGSESESATTSVSPTASKSPPRSESVTSSVSRAPTVTPSGICYSASRFNGQLSVLGSYYYILPGFNVSQPYGSGFISMGNFVGCSVIGVTCKCSYTGGSTVAGCSGKRNSYITYSYGTSDGYIFVNESPTCSYNFVGRIGISSSSPSSSKSLTLSPSYSSSMSLSPTSSFSQTICQAALGLYGAFEKVTGDVPYFVTHFIDLQHFRGVGIPNMLIGNYTSCNETATTCSCTYGPGLSVDGCPSGRFGTINYQFGLSTYTTFSRQYPACHYHFSGSVGILSPSPPISSTPSPSLSITATASSSFSISPTQSSSSSPSGSLTSSSSPSVSISGSQPASRSITRTLRSTNSLSESVSGSVTATPSITATSSITASPSRSLSVTLSVIASSSASLSITLSLTPSESLTAISSITTSVSPTITPSGTLSETPSKSQSTSQSASQSNTQSISSSETLSASQSPSVTVTPSESSSSAMSPSITGTPLVYCIPYPSSTPTAFETPTSTPLFMTTPWPLNRSASASTSPFFMMIRYPSSSPLPFSINATSIPANPMDITATVVGGVAVGALGLTSAFFLLQYLKKVKAKVPKPATEEKKDEKESQENRIQSTEVHMPDALTYLCINTVDLEDVTFLLTIFKKRFHVIDAPVNVTDGPFR